MGRYLKPLRRLALLAALAWAGYMVLFVEPSQCKDAVADATVVEICEPVPVTSVQVLFVAVVVGLLVLPEVNELEIAGLIKLRTRVAQAEAEVAEVRAQLAQFEASAAAQAVSGSLAASTTQINLHLAERQRATGLATQSLIGDPSSFTGAAEEVVEEVGEPAVRAVTAGLLGLAQTIPEFDGEVAVVGYTFAEDGEHLEPTHDVFGAQPDLLLQATALANDDALWDGALLAQTADSWIIAAPSFTADEEPVGALAATLTPTVDAPGDEDPPEEVIAAVEVAAETYARLLVDLLGEQPPEAG